MIPLRSSLRSSSRRSPHTTLLSTLSTKPTRSIIISRPSRDPTSVDAGSRNPSAFFQARNLHTSALLFKEKKWVNEAKEKDEAAKKDKEATSKEKDITEDAKVPSEPEIVAESSKTASERAKSSTPPSKPTVQASTTPPSPPTTPTSTFSSSPPASTEIAKVTIPTHYPQLLAIPITHRPLFPSFYKAVTVHNPAVCAAIRELLARGQPYIGAFLLKNPEDDVDVISSVDQVHPVGVFAQITSHFDGVEKGKGGAGEEGTKAMTIVLYPHRRIRIDDLVQQKEGEGKGESVPLVNVIEETIKEQEDPIGEEGEVASFEKGVPSPEQIKGESSVIKTEDTASETSDDEPSKPHSQINFLHSLLPDISITNVTNLEVEKYQKDSQMIRALMGELITTFKDVAQLHQLFREQIASFTMSHSTTNVFDEPERLADFAAAVSSAPTSDLQRLLETTSIEDRLQLALEILKKELINVQLQQKISSDVEKKLQKRQKEYYLNEQLKGIKKELGLEADGKDKLVDKFKEKAAGLRMPEGVQKVFDEEISKLMGLEAVSSEFNVTRNYLDWLTQVPWGLHTPENFNIPHAHSVLDEDHYGMSDVKDRILEFLAVGKLRGSVEGKIICLAGPPGVGKTSIGKSIARALGRQFYRFSVGGMWDAAEIKGHRRTYIGAMPGKPVQALKKVAVENPLILIDEIDKVGRAGGNHGDPSSALLEMLDPEQNSSFLDHYLDVPVDLSRVLFVCTANWLDPIPGPLRDRMEIINVSGYVTQEKMNIASKYLSPQAKEASGLKDVDITIDDGALEALIRYYCRESGVRNLKKQIEKVYRKAAFKIVQQLGETALPEPEAAAAASSSDSAVTQVVEIQSPDVKPPSERLPGDAAPVVGDGTTMATTAPRKPLSVPAGIVVRVTKDNLHEYVGPAVFRKDRLYTTSPPPGVSNGLGYTGDGSGSVMPIEVTSMPGKGSLQLTGKLGEVIRESVQIAMSWVKSNAYSLGATKSEAEIILNDRDLHLHMPEGAIGKEGPSAGTAILTALVSLFTKTRVDPDVAMTGEISLLGQVLPVGGLKEKVLAAQRAGMKKLIVPLACKPDIDENVPESVKAGIEFVFVEEVRQVLHEVFRGTEAAERWLTTLPVSKEAERVLPKSSGPLEI